jgi:N-acyl-D-amino-acid deacylase
MRLLRGATLADGVGAAPRRADLLLRGATIVHIAPEIPPGDDHEVFDLPAGSVVLPGFIDAHVHAESPLLATGRVDGALAQGVTTLVVGQDGASIVGADASTVDYLHRYFGAINDPVAARPYTVEDYAAAVRGRLAQNVAILAAHGTIRHNIAGPAPRPLEPAELAEAVRQVETALGQGAVGLSSGLEYVPGRFGDPAEITALTRPLAGAGRPYVSHLRGYGPHVGPALAELVGVGAAAGVRVHASHLWGPVADLAAAYREADAAGVGLTHDMYPYRRSSTILGMLLLPAAVQDGGPAETVRRLADPAVRAGLRREPAFSDEFLGRVTLGCLPDAYAELAGLSIVEAAGRAGAPAADWVMDLLVDGRLAVGGHLDRPGFDGDAMAWVLDHERHSAGSDGIYRGQHPHPRGFGAFARLAAHYRDPAVLARHAAAHPARVYGLRDRGRLLPGLVADITVIGPDGLRERATDADPTRPATGVHLVLVNGEPVWRDGRPVPGAAPGAVVH